MKTYNYSFQIKERHLDLLGHVNNATYLELFEEARWQIVTEHNLGLDSVMKTQVGPVILEVHLKFVKEVKNRERVNIETTFEGFSGKVGKVHQRLVNEAGESACEADFVVAVFDLKQRKIIEPPKGWLALS